MHPRTVAVAVAGTFAAHLASAQGPLNPPGPPAPTMKSLDELATKLDQANTKLDQTNASAEKRVDVLTLPGSATASHIISQPGSYFLGGNIIGGGKTAIEISASNVSLDLNGFVLDGAMGRSPASPRAQPSPTSWCGTGSSATGRLTVSLMGQ